MVSLFPMAQKSSADGHPFAHDSSINAQIVSNISALSYGHTNGYLLGGDIINDQAECNGSTQFGEYIDANSINGEALNGLQTHSQIFIAICGIALRLSGGLRTFQQLWEFLLDGGDARVRVFSSRYNVAAFHDSIGKHGTVIIEYGYFLDEDFGAFDFSFFQYAPDGGRTSRSTSSAHAGGGKGMLRRRR